MDEVIRTAEKLLDRYFKTDPVTYAIVLSYVDCISFSGSLIEN